MLNPSINQLEIKKAYTTTNQNVVIQAAPGSGKTTTLKYLLDFTPIQNKVQFIAFNKAIVQELESKISKQNVTFKTIHSIGLKSIYKNCKSKIKIYDLKNYVLIQRLNNDLWKLEKKELNGLIYNICKLYDHYRLYNINPTLTPKWIEEAVLFLDLDFDEVEYLKYFNEFLLLVNKHNKGLDKKEVMIDFIDMLYFPVHFNYQIEQSEEVFIDEAQDLNKLSQIILHKMIKKDGRFIAVGDKRQSIYSFLGADIKAFETLEALPNTIRLPLSVSYRCSKKVVEKANTIWSGVESFEKNIEGVVDNILSSEIRENDFVLCRNNQPIIEFYIKLLKQNKTAYIKGKDLGENLIKFIEKVNTEEDFNKHKDSQIFKLIQRLKAKGVTSPTSTKNFAQLMEKINIIEILYAEFKTYQNVKDKLKIMFNDKGVGIQLMTIHKSKGLEANRVFILRPDLIPSPYAEQPWEIEQEKNLEFVAYTRAIKELYFITDIVGPKKEKFSVEEIQQQ